MILSMTFFSLIDKSSDDTVVIAKELNLKDAYSTEVR